MDGTATTKAPLRTDPLFPDDQIFFYYQFFLLQLLNQ